MLTTLLAIAIGWCINPVNRQKAFIQEIHTQQIDYAYELESDLKTHEPIPPVPQWLVDKFGIDCFASVQLVDAGRQTVDSLEFLSGLPNRKHLNLASCPACVVSPLMKDQELIYLVLADTLVSSLESKDLIAASLNCSIYSNDH